MESAVDGPGMWFCESKCTYYYQYINQCFFISKSKYHPAHFRWIAIAIWKNDYGRSYMDCQFNSRRCFVREFLLRIDYEEFWTKASSALHVNPNDCEAYLLHGTSKSLSLMNPYDWKFQTSWLLVIFAQHFYCLYLARLLHGVVAGGVTVVAPVYLLEISSDRYEYSE